MANHFESQKTAASSTAETLTGDVEKTVHVFGEFDQAHVLGYVRAEAGDDPRVFDIWTSPREPYVLKLSGDIYFELVGPVSDKVSISVKVLPE